MKTYTAAQIAAKRKPARKKTAKTKTGARSPARYVVQTSSPGEPWRDELEHLSLGAAKAYMVKTKAMVAADPTYFAVGVKWRVKKKLPVTRQVEPFSMEPRVHVGKVAVRMLEGGHIAPAINVKVPPLFHRMPPSLQQAPEHLSNEAFEDAQRYWWQELVPVLADKHLGRAFGAHEVGADGRSGGWLVVRGVPNPDDWSPAQHRAWASFEKAVKESMKAAEKMFYKQLAVLMRRG